STPRRRFAAIGALCLGAFALGTAFQAATATPAASRAVGPTSVAIVNLNRIAEGLDEMKEKLDKLKADVDAYNARLDDLKKRSSASNPGISTMGDPTTGQAIRARRAKLQEQLELEVLLKARQESLQQMLDLEIGSLMRQAYFKIEAACKQLGESEGWDL